jgi:cytochrome c biogenesis protein CcmG/thiol:disulfide interchange protein DsbE
MIPRLPLFGLVFTAVLTLIGCLLIVGGVWFAFSTLQPAGLAIPTPDGSGLLPGALSASGPRVGSLAPDFSLKGLDQQTVQLGQLRGKVVLLNFWATWCGPCSAEMPNIEQVYQGLSHQDVAVLAVNQGEFADQVQGYADLYHLHFPILLDGQGKVGNLYRVQALPTTVLIDRRGIVREIHIGGPMSKDFIQTHIQSLMRQAQ